MVQHPADQYTYQKGQEIRSCMLFAFFFLFHPRAFSAHDFVKLPPFRNSYPGSHGTHSSPFPTTVLAFVQVAKKKRFIIRLPSLASPCVELVCIHATYQYNTQHAGCEALSAAVLILKLLFQALISPRTNTYLISSCNLLVVYI